MVKSKTRKLSDSEVILMAIEYVSNMKITMRDLAGKWKISKTRVHIYLHDVVKLDKKLGQYVVRKAKSKRIYNRVRLRTFPQKDINLLNEKKLKISRLKKFPTSWTVYLWK